MAKYNGSVELISGITPANGQDFPLVAAHAVQVDDDGTRLDEALKRENAKKIQDFGLVWIKWTNNLDAGGTVEDDAVLYSKHDMILTQRLDLNKLADSRPMFTEKTTKILCRAKELNSSLRLFEYIQSDSGRTDFTYNKDHAHLNPDGTWEGSTADLSGCTRIYTFDQFCEWFDFFKETNADGVFFDDWGYDFSKEDICYQFGWDPNSFADINEAKNKKWIKLIDACHSRGLSVITNGGMPFEVGDWYTHLNESDVICLESCMISSAGNTWNSGHNNVYNYWKNWYTTGKCKAKLWVLAYTPGGSKEFSDQIVTYVCAMGLVCGANYISVGVGRCLEFPPFVEAFSTTSGINRNIKKIDDNIYCLESGMHKLEVHKWSGLSGVVTENNIARNYYLYDGYPFNNAFVMTPSTEYIFSKRIVAMDDTIKSMTDDTRKNASSYWRMAIDDWQPGLTYMDYENLIALNASNFSYSYPDKANATVVKNNDGTIDLVIKYTNCQQMNVKFEIITSSNYDEFNLTGKELEYGFSDVIFNMDEGSWTLPNGTAYYGTSDWAIPSFLPYFGYVVDGTTVGVSYIKGVGSDIGENTGHYERTKTGEITSLWANVWIRSPGEDKLINGTITLKNLYLVDTGEHSDEISKKWYTNIFPTNFNNSSAMTAKSTPSSKNGWKTYDLLVSHTDAWGWTKYKYTGDEVIALRGHTIELGCTLMTFSNGETGIGSSSNGWVNYAFGLGVNTDNPNTVRLYANTQDKSEVWDGEKICCLKYTIPNDATSLVIGFQSYGFATTVTVSLKDVYMYDLGEEVSIRGKDSTNASLRLCRINEEQEELTPSKMRNALYITEKGGMYCYDLKGVKVDIAGSIYIGAAKAGYTGSPEEFGNALYQLIQKIDL